MKGSGGDIVYLDFDGVLHHENVVWSRHLGAYLSAPAGYVLFQHCDLLIEVLEPYPQIQIVLSTSWSRVYGCAKAAKMLPPKLRTRVIGATWHWRMDKIRFMQKSRGEQVWGDVSRRKPRAWIALDDDYENWPTHCNDHYTRTHPTEGVSDPEVLALLRAKLAEMFTR